MNPCFWNFCVLHIFIDTSIAKWSLHIVSLPRSFDQGLIVKAGMNSVEKFKVLNKRNSVHKTWKLLWHNPSRPQLNISPLLWTTNCIEWERFSPHPAFSSDPSEAKACHKAPGCISSHFQPHCSLKHSLLPQYWNRPKIESHQHY